MKLPPSPRYVFNSTSRSARSTAIFAAITALFFVAAINDARAQFTFANDNADNYGGAGEPTWTNGANAGTGWDAWTLATQSGATNFIGNPSASGISTTGIGTSAFGMRATEFNNYANITRSLSTGLGMGDSLSFYWGVNWDTDNGTLNKGFNLRAGDTQLFNVNMSGSTDITVNGANTGFAYGTDAMLVTVTRTATGYSFSMTSRSGGSTFSTTVASTATLNTFAGYAGNNNGDINRNIYFNNFTNANSGIFSQGGSVSNGNNFTGTGNLSIGNNTALTISGTATYSGTTTITNGGLVLANGGNYTFASAVSGAGSLSKNGAGAVTITGNSTGFSGETILNNGSFLVGNANAFGTGTVTINFNDGTGTRTLASSSATGYTLNNNFNLYYNSFSLGSADTGSLTLGGADKVFFLGGDGGVQTRTITVTGSHTIGAEITGGANNRLNVGGGGTLTLANANTFSGGAQVTSGTLLVGNNAALGTGAFAFNFNNAAGTRVLASSSSAGYTLNNDFNVFDNTITIGQTEGGTGSLVLGGTGKNFNLGSDGEPKSRLVTVNGSHTIAGNLTGGANNNIVKKGDGTLTLSGANNTFEGGLFVDSGVVSLSGGALSGGTVLDIGGGADGNAVNASDATLRVSAASSYGRNIIVNAQTNSSGVSGSRYIEFANSAGTGTLTGTVALEKTVSTDVSNSAATGVLSGVISGVGGITKTGAGTLTLSGAAANSYSGLTTVSAGTLNLSKSTGNAIAGAVTVNSGAVLLLSASTQVASDAVTLSGGTIRRGGNVSEVFGSLTLSTDSFLDFGASNATGTLSFGSYTPSALLTVQNFLPGNKLQFTSTLTTEQLNDSELFSFGTGFTTSTEGSYFTITAIPEPSTYVAAAGLLALFLWPARRRLIKDVKSILGLRPTGRDRIEAYRRGA